MKAKLIFDLEDSNDRLEHLRCVKALDMSLVLWDMLYNTKKELLYDCSEEFEKGVEAVYDKLYQFLEEHSVNVDELVV